MTARTSHSPKKAGAHHQNQNKDTTRTRKDDEEEEPSPVSSSNEMSPDDCNSTATGGGGGGGGQSNSGGKKERWVCDKCKIQTFDTFDEACAHEEECCGGPPPSPSPPSPSSSPATALGGEAEDTAPGPAAVAVNDDTEEDTDEEGGYDDEAADPVDPDSYPDANPPEPSNVTSSAGEEGAEPAIAAADPAPKKTREVYLCDVCKVAQFDDYDEACRHEENCQGATAAAAGAAAEAEVEALEDKEEEAEADIVGSDVIEAPPASSTAAAVGSSSSDNDEDEDDEDVVVVADEEEEAVATAADDDDGNRSVINDEVEEEQSNIAPSKKKTSKAKASRNKQKTKATSAGNNKDSKRKKKKASSSSAAADAAAAPIFQKRKQPERATGNNNFNNKRGSKKAKQDAAGADESGATVSAAEAAAANNPNPKTLAAIFTSPRPTKRGGNKGGGRGAAASAGNGTAGGGSGVGGDGDGPSPGTALLNEHRAAEVAAKFAAERRAKAERERERKRKREEEKARDGKEREKKTTKPRRNNDDDDDDEAAPDSDDADEVKVVGGNTKSSTSSKQMASIFARPRKRTTAAATAAAVPNDAGSSATGGKNSAAKACKVASLSAASGRSAGTVSAKPKHSYPSAPKFPVPSHIMSVNNDTCKGSEGMGIDIKVGAKSRSSSSSSSSALPSDKIEVGSRALVGAARYQDEGRIRQDYPSAPNIPLLCTNDDELPVCADSNVDELARAFASVMSPPPVSVDDDACAELWSKKYTMQRIPEDVCGQKNKESAASLMKFINEWKAHRAEFVKKMEEKRKSLGSRKRKKKSSNRSSYYKDEDLWYDSDEEDFGLCNVFLLNGPHGTGKSALVHAAAQQAGCVLVEINTTEKRSGSGLKRAIEECTQSHSSLALLKRGTNPAFGGFGAQRASQEIADDSSDESDGDEDEEKIVGDRGRLAIILIDEVDNIFENDGDAGFWVALANLTKKAKCPIILTSSAVPVLLEASSIRFQTASMMWPSPLECASKMRHVAKMEEMMDSGIDDKDGEWDKGQMCRIAEFCNCDLRSILNAMQLHSHGVSSLRREEQEEARVGSILNAAKAETTESLALDGPKISEVAPRIVDANSYSVLTIKGTKFTGSDGNSNTDVVIGGRPSPALRVIDDNTILAVCPPCAVPKGVDASGAFEDSFEACITCRHASVVVKVTVGTALVLRSDSLVPASDSNSYGKRCNIEYSFPSFNGRLENMCSKRENARRTKREEGLNDLSSDDDDFVVPTFQAKENGKEGGAEIANVVSMTSETVEEAPQASDVDIGALLENQVKEYLENESIDAQLQQQKQQKPPVNGEVLSQLDQISKGLEYSSDAALLEDSFSSLAIPSLSGAVKGFGSDFVDQQSLSGNSAAVSKKLRNTNAKPPSIEKIFTSGWNDSAFFFGACDSYVTLPTLRRDRCQLSKAHAYSNMNAGISSASRSEVDDNSKSSSSNTGASSSNLGMLQSASQSVDDSFLQLCSSSPLFSLPSIMRASAKLPFSENLALLTTRRNEKTTLAIASTSALFDDAEATSTFCLGLGERTNQTTTAFPLDLDNRFGLDYLPSLKAMAAAEHEAEKKYQALKEKNPDALGLQDTSSRRRSTRRTAKSGRANYFADRIINGHGMRHDEVSSLAKRTCADLSKTILSFH